MKFLLLLLITIFTVTVNAQDINFNFTNGSSESYNIEDIRKITFDNNLMILHLTDGSVYTIDTETIEGNSYTESALSNINQIEINVFPNPVQNELNVSVSSDKPVTITILDQNSKTIIETNNFTIDVSNLTPATYIVIVKVNNITKSVKLIKQ